ncbi:hypothetical protein N879_13080 [Alcaligenes sp. EGD-AK7]|nr:hypothetical protein N879_13080 [Alcaligenes sp. EGD-AK7]
MSHFVALDTATYFKPALVVKSPFFVSNLF